MTTLNLINLCGGHLDDITLPDGEYLLPDALKIANHPWLSIKAENPGNVTLIGRYVFDQSEITLDGIVMRPVEGDTRFMFQINGGRVNFRNCEIDASAGACAKLIEARAGTELNLSALDGRDMVIRMGPGVKQGIGAKGGLVQMFGNTSEGRVRWHVDADDANRVIVGLSPSRLVMDGVIAQGNNGNFIRTFRGSEVIIQGTHGQQNSRIEGFNRAVSIAQGSRAHIASVAMDNNAFGVWRGFGAGAVWIVRDSVTFTGNGADEYDETLSFGAELMQHGGQLYSCLRFHTGGEVGPGQVLYIGPSTTSVFHERARVPAAQAIRIKRVSVLGSGGHAAGEGAVFHLVKNGVPIEATRMELTGVKGQLDGLSVDLDPSDTICAVVETSQGAAARHYSLAVVHSGTGAHI